MNNDQPTFWDQDGEIRTNAPGLARRDHPTTSHDAAEQVEPISGQLRRAVYEFLVANPEGATDEEMQHQLGMAQNTQRPRRRELVTQKRVVDSGRTRKTKSGRWAIVWVVADGRS